MDNRQSGTASIAEEELSNLETLGIGEEMEAEIELQDELEKAPERDAQEEMCVACGVMPQDKNRDAKAIFCEACYQKYLKYPFPKWILGLLAGLAAVFAFACIYFPSGLKDYQRLSEAAAAFDENRYYDAARIYKELADKYKGTLSLSIPLTQAYMNHGDYYSASEAINNYIVGKSLSDSEYEKVDGFSHRLDVYYNTYNKIQEEFNKLSSDDADNSQKANEALNALLQSEEEVDKPLIYSYLIMVSQTDEEYMDLLARGVREYPENAYLAVQYANTQRHYGYTSEAERLYQQVLREDQTDAGAIRGMSILRMLEGKKEEALTLALRAYEIDPLYLYVPETVVIAYNEAGLRDKAEEFLENMSSEEYQIEADLQNYLDGKISLKKYYMQ